MGSRGLRVRLSATALSGVLLLAAMVGACTQGPAPVGSGTTDSGMSSDAMVGCVSADCAGLPAPADAKVCPDGSSLSRTVCAQGLTGQCGWEFPPCPPTTIDGGICQCAGPMPKAANVICPDGSLGGPICAGGPNGTCAWQVQSCPVPVDACPGLGCAPACPNGVLKDNNGCDTCQCAPVAEGGSDAGHCQRNGDCPAGGLCGYPVADKCSAVGTCFPSPGVICNAIVLGCACGGSEVNTACNGLPSGYAPAPLLHAGVCSD